MTVVIDASLLGAALVSSADIGLWAESVIAGHDLAAPELILAETGNVLHRLERSGSISTLEANSAHRDLQRLDLVLFPYAPFADRIWQLRTSLNSYDAWYVAVAEALGCELATLDQRLTRALGPACTFMTPNWV